SHLPSASLTENRNVPASIKPMPAKVPRATPVADSGKDVIPRSCNGFGPGLSRPSSGCSVSSRGRKIIRVVFSPYIKYDVRLAMAWTVVYLSDVVRAEVEALAPELRSKFQRIVELIKAKGLEQVRQPYVKHIEGKLWEMRMIGRDNIARAIYMTASGQRVVVLHAFIKKTDRTPPVAL